VLLAGLWRAAGAEAPLLVDVHTIAGGDAATRVEPFEREITLAQDGSHDLTLTDLATPAPFAALQVAVTSAATVVVPAAGAGTVHFQAAAGTYVVHVVGALSAGQSSASFGLRLVRSGDGAPVLDVAQVMALPPGSLPSNVQVIDTTFDVTSAGDYELSLNDATLPEALATLTLLITKDGAPVLTLNGPTASPVTLAGLQAGTYQLFAAGQAGATSGAGVFGVRVRRAGGADVLTKVATIGGITSLGTATLPACASCVLTLTDFALPAALTQAAVAVIQGGAVTARAALSGGTPSAMATFGAAAGDYQVLAYAQPAAVPGTGSYGVDVRPQGAASASFAAVQTAGGSQSGATPAFTFDVDVPSAGTYTLRVADFQFPQSFTTLNAAAVQNGTLLGSINAAGTTGTANVALAAGPLTLLVAAQPTATDGGLFGVDVTPAAGGAAIYRATQGAGGAFRATRLTLPAAANYELAVQDLGFPAPFTALYAILTQGASRLGVVYGGGGGSATLHTDATAGDAVINILAQPSVVKAGAAQRAGTYAVTLAPTPPPSVTLTASATQVQSGDTVTLTWSSSQATSCTASGGWSGARAVSGSATSAALTATTTFTLECSGDGGSASQSVTVSVATQSASGGGGALDPATAVLLALGALLRVGARAAPRRAT
jgi:plastocyanin